MKILHVNFAKGFRGGERQTELLIRALHEQGLEQDLMVREGSALAERLSDLPSLNIRYQKKPYATYKVPKGAYDVVQAHEVKAAQWALINYWRTKVPYVVTRRVTKVPSSSPFTSQIYKQAAAVTCVSSAVKVNLLRSVPSLTVTVIPDMCARMQACPEKVAALRSEYQDAYVIGHIGALEELKGQHVLIEAVRSVDLENPRVLMLGTGKDEEKLREMVAGDKRFCFTGFQRDVAAYIDVFDLFVFPSFEEGLGSTLLDVMDAGVPIIASNVGGIPEVIQDGHNGLLVESRKPEPIADAVIKLKNDNMLAQRLSQQASEDVKQYHPDAIARQYCELFRNLGL